MSKRTFILAHKEARDRASKYCWEAPEGQVVVFSEPTRNSVQNALMWSCLGEISEQVTWYEQKLTPEEWKHVFSASLKQQRVVPGIDGGFVILGQSTSRMTKKEFSELLELIYAFGAEHGVEFSDGRSASE